MADTLSSFTLFPVKAEIPSFSHSDFKMVLSFAIIGSIAATALKFKQHQKVRKQEFYL